MKKFIKKYRYIIAAVVFVILVLSVVAIVISLTVSPGEPKNSPAVSASPGVEASAAPGASPTSPASQPSPTGGAASPAGGASPLPAASVQPPPTPPSLKPPSGNATDSDVPDSYIDDLKDYYGIQ